MKRSQQNLEKCSKQREQSRIERLQKNARFGEIVFTKHGVYEARPCEKCSLHHRVFYPPVLITCEGQTDIEGNRCRIQNLDRAVHPKIIGSEDNGEAASNSPCHSRSDIRNKRQLGSIFRGTNSAKQYLSGLKCANMGFHGQTTTQRSCSAASSSYPKYSRHKHHEESSINGSNTSLDIREETSNSCEVCLLAEENKFGHITAKGEATFDIRGSGGCVQGAVQCPTCSQWMCFRAESEEEIERLVKKEILIQEEDALKQRLAKGREQYKKTLKKLKSAEEKFEKVIADVAETVSGELKNIDDEDIHKKTMDKQSRKFMQTEIHDDNRKLAEHTSMTQIKISSTSIEQGNEHDELCSSTDPAKALSDYFRKLYRSQSDTGLKTDSSIHDNGSVSDILIVLPNERPLDDGSWIQTNKDASQWEFNPTIVSKDNTLHIDSTGARVKKSKAKWSNANKIDSFETVSNHKQTSAYTSGGDSISTGRRKVSLQTNVVQKNVRKEEKERSKPQTPGSMSSCSRKLPGSDSNFSVKKISFAGDSGGEEIKPINSQSSSTSTQSRLRSDSDGENDNYIIPSRKTSSIIEHVDSLILLESSLSLRNGSQLMVSNAENESEKPEKAEEHGGYKHKIYKSPLVQCDEILCSKERKCSRGRLESKEGVCSKEKLHKIAGDKDEWMDQSGRDPLKHDNYVSYGAEEVIPQSEVSGRRPSSLTSKTSETHSIMKKTSQHYCKYCKENKAQYDQQDEGNSRNQSHQQKQTCTKDAKVLEVDHIKKTPSVQFCQCESSSDKHVQRKDNYSGPSFKDKDCENVEMGGEQECRNQEPLSPSPGRPVGALPPQPSSSMKSDSTNLKCANCTENLETRVPNNDANGDEFCQPPQRKSIVTRTTERSDEECLQANRTRLKSSTLKYSASSSARYREKLARNGRHHSKRSHSAAFGEKREKLRYRKSNEKRESNKYDIRSSKPPIYGGSRTKHRSGSEYPTDQRIAEQRTTSCPPTLRNKNGSYFKKNKSSNQQCVEVTTRGKELLTAGKECEAMEDKFDKNYSSVLDCMEAQSKLENQMCHTTDSELHKSISDMLRHRHRRKRRSTSLDSRKLQRRNMDGQPGNDILSDLSLNDIESSLNLLLNPPLSQTYYKSKTSKGIGKRQHSILDQIIELHVGQAAMTDSSITSMQHSDSHVSNPIFQKSTTGALHPKQKKSMKPSSQHNISQNKNECKARRETLLHHLLVNEAQADNGSLCTMDSDTYESLHILVGKFIQSQERKKIKHGRRKDRYVPTQLEAIRATSHKDFPSANNNTELPKKEFLPVIVKTCEDDSTKPTVGKSHIFVPQKIGSISSYASSNLPKLRKAHYSNSKRRQPLAAVNLDSRTQVVGFSGSSNSAGAGVNPTRDEVLEASNKLEPVQKLGMKCVQPSVRPQRSDILNASCNMALPPISTKPNFVDVSKVQQKTPVTLPSQELMYNSSAKKVSIRMDESQCSVAGQQEDHNDKGSFLKRMYNSIFKP